MALHVLPRHVWLDISGFHPWSYGYRVRPATKRPLFGVAHSVNGTMALASFDFHVVISPRLPFHILTHFVPLPLFAVWATLLHTLVCVRRRHAKWYILQAVKCINAGHIRSGKSTAKQRGYVSATSCIHVTTAVVPIA